MQKRITHVAMDDSKHTLVMGILRAGVQEPDLVSIPNEPRRVRRVFARLQREGPVLACCDAGPSGDDLYRQLTVLDVPCQVIAPSLTPRKPYQGTQLPSVPCEVMMHYETLIAQWIDAHAQSRGTLSVRGRLAAASGLPGAGRSAHRWRPCNRLLEWCPQNLRHPQQGVVEVGVEVG